MMVPVKDIPDEQWFAPQRIEKIARAMAVADGLDPDETTGGGSNTFTLKAVDFNAYAIALRAPTWKSYQREANLFLAALKASAEPFL